MQPILYIDDQHVLYRSIQVQPVYEQPAAPEPRLLGFRVAVTLWDGTHQSHTCVRLTLDTVRTYAREFPRWSLTTGHLPRLWNGVVIDDLDEWWQRALQMDDADH